MECWSIGGLQNIKFQTPNLRVLDVVFQGLRFQVPGCRYQEKEKTRVKSETRTLNTETFEIKATGF